jgi:hypothetical protein
MKLQRHPTEGNLRIGGSTEVGGLRQRLTGSLLIFVSSSKNVVAANAIQGYRSMKRIL